MVTFDPATALEHEEVEFLAFGNELVDSLVDHVRRREYPGRASHRRIRTNDCQPRTGWFFVVRTRVRRCHDDPKEIFPVFVGSDGMPDDAFAAWLVERATNIKREEWRDSAPYFPPRDDAS